MPDTTIRPWFCQKYDETTGWRCPAPTHDNYSAHSYGCRSGATRIARSRYLEDLKAGRARVASPIGIIRRIEACHYVGHGGPAIGRALGIDRRLVNRVLRGHKAFMWTSTVARWAPVLEGLAMTPAGNGSYDRKVRSWARNKGFRPLLAWDDIDDPDAVPAEVDELRDEIVALTARGFTQAQIAQRLGRSVNVVRKRLGRAGDVAVELDEHLLSEAAAGRVPLGELSDVEQDVVVERLWAHFLPICELEDKPGNEVAARLGVDLLTVQRIHANRRMRELRADREAS